MYLLLFLIFGSVHSLQFKYTIDNEYIDVSGEWLSDMIKSSYRIKTVDYSRFNPNDFKNSPIPVKNTGDMYNPYAYPCVDVDAFEYSKSFQNSTNILGDNAVNHDSKCVPFHRGNSITKQYWNSGNERWITKMHYDTGPNFLWCERGRKIFFLWNRTDRELLYLKDVPRGQGWNSESPYALETVNYTTYPNVKKAKRFVVEVNAKDVLFIPTRWAHHVYTSKDTFCISHWENYDN